VRALYLLKALQTQFCGTNLTFNFPMPNSKSLAILRVSWWSFPRAHTRMPPKGRSWKELTWSWAYSTGHPASDQKLEAAARAAWSYSSLCAWTYLNDPDAAVDLMDHAVHNASQYLTRHSDVPEQKLTARIKSVIRRRARQLAAKRSHELPSGSMRDMEQIACRSFGGRTENLCERAVFEPFANRTIDLPIALARILLAGDRRKTRDGPQCCASCILSRNGVGSRQSFLSWRFPKMRLSWRRPSRAEDRLESWLSRHHEERVLAGETNPVGPCPDEAFLRDLARKTKRIELSDPRVDHAANCPRCMTRLLALRQENRSRRRKMALVTAVALCSVIAVVAIVVARFGVDRRLPASELAVQSVTVNLWDAGTIRGNQPGSLQSVSLPAALVKLTVLLPRFSAPGQLCGGCYAGSEWKRRRCPANGTGDDQW
jgi:hypothetical protein